MSGRPAEVTLPELEGKVGLLSEKLTREEIDYVVDRWRQGRELELPLEKVEDLLVRPEEIKRTVEDAVKKILRHLESRLGGVEFFSIESPRRLYGTGKSQVAYFICDRLSELGVHTEYIVVNLGEVESGRFRERLWELGGSVKKAALFVDEVDILASPELEESRQKRVIEIFANALIEYSEGLSRNKEYRHALVLVLSHKAKESIERVAHDRLGRRLMNSLARPETKMTKDDVFDLFKTAVALAAIDAGLSGEELLSLAWFVNDFSRYLWRDSDLSSISIGQAVALALNLALDFAHAVKRCGAGRVQRNLMESTRLGARVEEVVKETLSRALPRFSFRDKDLDRVVECVLDRSRVRVDCYEADLNYSIRLGGLEVGKCLVEVTTENELSSRKRKQLEAFTSRYPVILLSIREPQPTERVDEPAEDLYGSIYEVERIDISLPLLKYSAAVEEHGVDLAYKIASELKLHESIEAVLQRFASMLVHFWFAREKAKEASKKPTEEREKVLGESLRSSLKAIVVEVSGAKKRKSISVIRRMLEESLMVDSNLAEQYATFIAKKWTESRLGRLTEEYFIKSESWNEEKALEVALSVLTPSMLQTKASSGLDKFLSN